MRVDEGPVALRACLMRNVIRLAADLLDRIGGLMTRAVRRSHGVAMCQSNAVGCSSAVNLVAARVVAVVSPAVATRKAEERHCGNAGGAEYQAEDGEVHLSVR